MIEFRRHRTQPAAVTPASEAEPVTGAGSFIEFLKETTPGGAVTAQIVITIMVYVMFVTTAPPTPRGIMLSAIVLCMTPWVPAILGFGDPIAASIVFTNVVAGAYLHKAFLSRTE